jgi:Ribbon-helix-helix protein, copG family
MLIEGLTLTALRRDAPQIGVRVDEDLLKLIDEWRRKQDDVPTRPEAIRRLVDLGLTIKTRAKQSSPTRATRARELATKAIDKVIDATAPPEERAQRRRRLTKGPLEFRDVRVDLPKAKGK